ncbi:hypothetical protein HAX54_011171 [Datura stramonium]|uniref:Uncharacterized protein n=1 Tax=Datura stramonium TaxID=4076 RepID=A0ABS8TIA3_DATST|nr:hypothetical protein [Datura stramonium]
MKEFYIAFKEKRVIHAEAQFDVESFKTACPDIYYQIGMRYWGPFTILVDPYLTKLVWEFYASYRARQQLVKHRGCTEAFSCLASVWVRGQEANNVITLATKIDKEAPVMKRAKYTGNMTPPSPSASTHTTAPLHTTEFHNSPPPDLLNIAQRAKIHENQLVQLVKAISSMIQSAIKKALHPAKDKLASLFSIVDVLESEVGTLKQEVAALTASPSISQPNPCEHEAVPEAPRSPPDDWWVGYGSD